MVLSHGDKVLVVHRRLFAEDDSRFFAGQVDEREGELVRATGWSFSWNHYEGAYVKKDQPRTKVLPLGSGALIAYVLPREVELERLEVLGAGRRDVQLSDGKGFRMDLTEHSSE